MRTLPGTETRGDRRRLAFGAGAIVLCGAVVVLADPYDALAGDLGFFAVLLACVAAALAVSAPWAVVLPLLLALGVPWNAREDPLIFGAFVVFGAVAAAVFVAVLVGLRSVAERRAPATGPWFRRSGLAIGAVAVGLAAWGVWLDVRVHDHRPDRPSVVAERPAAFRGVVVGESAAALRRRLGRPVIAERPEPPLGDPELRDGPNGFSGSQRYWRYRGVVAFVVRGRVVGFFAQDDDAQTARGVGPGDSLEVARRRYPGLECDGVREGSDSTNDSYPACDARVGGVGVAFYGDPIQSVWVGGG